jgi:hypothetical protein
MDNNFNDVVRDVYSAHLDRPPNVEVQIIPGSISPVRLALSILVPANSKFALVRPPEGAILEIPLDKEAALEIFRGIRTVAQTMGWLLPTEDEGLI